MLIGRRLLFRVLSGYIWCVSGVYRGCMVLGWPGWQLEGGLYTWLQGYSWFPGGGGTR
jgi:hypothetical protein